jgi:hypothetical protein
MQNRNCRRGPVRQLLKPLPKAASMIEPGHMKLLLALLTLIALCLCVTGCDEEEDSGVTMTTWLPL